VPIPSERGLVRRRIICESFSAIGSDSLMVFLPSMLSARKSWI
jgi:hypothetical protein